MTIQATESRGGVIQGAVTDVDGRLIVVGPGGSPLAGGPDPDATPQNTSSTGAASAITTSIPAAAGKTSYLTGFEVTGAGATAGTVVVVTITGVPNTLNYVFTVPTGATTQAQPLQVEFPEPIAASAPNTAVVVNVPSFGAGNTNAAVVAHGFQL